MQPHPQIEPVKSIEDKVNDLKQWIDRVSETNPDLKGFSICPFAKHHTYKIISSSIHDIQPLSEEFGVVIFLIEDDVNLELARQKIEELNQKYPKYKFFDDFRDEPSYIGPVQTNNGRYNLILYQNTEFLTKMRCILAKTSYYDSWNEHYLKEILKDDYEIVRKIGNK